MSWGFILMRFFRFALDFSCPIFHVAAHCPTELLKALEKVARREVASQADLRQVGWRKSSLREDRGRVEREDGVRELLVDRHVLAEDMEREFVNLAVSAVESAKIERLERLSGRRRTERAHKLHDVHGGVRVGAETVQRHRAQPVDLRGELLEAVLRSEGTDRLDRGVRHP